MPYIQVETRGGYITRSYTLSILARVDGYPGYLANIGDNRKLVRTILYLEDDILYLSDDKRFILSTVEDENDGYIWIFSSYPDTPPLRLSTIAEIWGAQVYPWRSEWANMKTDSPDRNDLLWPVRTWEEAWNIIEERGYTVMIKRIRDNRWISAIDSFGTTSFVTAGFAWKREGAPFSLIKRDNQWGLRYLNEGTVEATKTFIVKPNRTGLYVWPWREGGSDRWLLTESIGNALFWNVESFEDGVYEFLYQNKRLNQGRCWRIRPIASCTLGTLTVTDGVEFANTSQSNIDISLYVINPGLTDVDKYILSQNRFIYLMRDQNNQLPQWIPENISVNLPRGRGICNENEWEGTNMNCYQRSNLPYTQIRGQEQCTTLDDFSHDIHCQQWAINNKGNRIDTLLSSLCQNVSVNEYQDVCGCYLPDNVYYTSLLQQRRDDPELARQIANDVRSTNLLQCVSGLCTPGSFSANVFYNDSRRCDICIQALRADIQAGGDILGNIDLRQVCTQADITYTWDGLIERLIDLGAYKLIQDRDTGMITSTGIYPHVVINQNNTSIKFITTTEEGMNTLQSLRSLSLLNTRDTQGNIILTQDVWRTNPTLYTTESILFLLDARE